MVEIDVLKEVGVALLAKVKPGTEVYIVQEIDRVASVSGPYEVASVTFYKEDAPTYGISDVGGGNGRGVWSANKLFTDRAAALKAAGETQEVMIENLWGQFAQANVQEEKGEKK